MPSQLKLIDNITDHDMNALWHTEDEVKKIRKFSNIINTAPNVLPKDYPSQIFKTVVNNNPFLYNHNNQLQSFTTMTGSPLLLFHNKLERPSDLILLENTIKVLNSGIKQNIINVLSQQGEDVREIVLEENKHFTNYHNHSAISQKSLSIADATDTTVRKTIDKQKIKSFFDNSTLYQESVHKVLNEYKKIIDKAKKLEDKIITKNKLF